MSTRFIEGKTCLHCDGPIQSRGPKRDAAVIFCSVACRGAYSKAQSIAEGKIVSTECEVCGTPITFYASMRPQGAYCSMSCKSIGHARKLTGRIQDDFGRNATFRKSMRRFFYDRCSLCGWDAAPCDIAHIDGLGNGGSNVLDNVTILCPNHHRMFDCGLIPIEEIKAARANAFRPDWRESPEWLAWKQARSKLSNLMRWHPEDAEAISAARLELAELRQAAGLTQDQEP